MPAETVPDPNLSILQSLDINPSTYGKKPKVLVTPDASRFKSKNKMPGMPGFNDKKHKCDECDYTTDKASVLSYHVNAVHNKMKTYQCTECDFKSADLANLKSHGNSVHRKLKRHQCPECEYGAFNATILRRHMNSVHKKLKPHNCPGCNYCATSASHIKRHIQRNHINGGEGQIGSCQPKPDIPDPVYTFPSNAVHMDRSQMHNPEPAQHVPKTNIMEPGYTFPNRYAERFFLF